MNGEPCQRCQGTGQVLREIRDRSGGTVRLAIVVCPLCRGRRVAQVDESAETLGLVDAGEG